MVATRSQGEGGVKDETSPHHVAKIYLRPGNLYVGKRPARVTTVLGSCVAVTLYAPEQRVGAICHGMLPKCPVLGRQDSINGCNENCFRYVDCSIRYMLRVFDKQKISRHVLQVKVFGGADMFGPSGSGALDVMGSGSTKTTVGRQNLDIALDTIRKEGLQVFSSNLGGGAGRKLHFYTHTGEVLLKHLNNSMQELSSLEVAILPVSGRPSSQPVLTDIPACITRPTTG